MPLNDQAYLIPGTAFVYRAPAGTVKPAATNAALSAPPAPWVLLGHLGLDDGTGMPAFEYEGGETTTKGSMSKKAIRSRTTPVARSVVFSMSQFTREVLGMYHGGDGGATTGYFDVKSVDDGATTPTALLFTFNDGGVWAGWHAQNTAVGGAEGLTTDDVENALLLPLRATLLDPVTGDVKFSWISADLLSIPAP